MTVQTGSVIAGYAIATEARSVRTGVFSGVFHVGVDRDGRSFSPPVAIIVPGQWKTADEAHRAAADYAAVMAGDGALAVALQVRHTVIR